MKEESKKRIEELTDRFRRNADVYKNGAYNETQVRREFIDPFFEALGWDVANRAGYAEQYKDVVHEDSIKIGVSLKAPDYSFRIRYFRFSATLLNPDFKGGNGNYGKFQIQIR